jgi:hypothetical protein
MLLLWRCDSSSASVAARTCPGAPDIPIDRVHPQNRLITLQDSRRPRMPGAGYLTEICLDRQPLPQPERAAVVEV